MPTDRHVAFTEFDYGPLRPVHERPGGRQYVIDNDGELVFGIWFIPRDEAVSPVIVEE
jgi:hypothetical protein